MNDDIFEKPYFSEEMIFKSVPAQNEFINLAKEYARKYSLDKAMPIGSVLVNKGDIIGIGANGSDYHNNHICERVRQKIPTGQGYELCEGCHPKNHSEQKAIQDAIKKGNKTEGTDLYLWGHWWCCRWCMNAIKKAGIKNVFLLEKSEILFNKNKSGNIINRQFDS
ncbi:MAG: deaminase [Candidatus Taylorbacteria bacterium]|nr:deaminase [Candidatus Taylorbacteria bacterium]